MKQRFATPAALVEGLHNRVVGAREQLWEWVGEPIRRLMTELRERHQLSHSLERMTRHALHAVETFLRTRSPRDFANLSAQAFRGALLMQVARQVLAPFGGSGNGKPAAPDPLPEHGAYDSQTVYLPSEKVGSFWFGGDWYGGIETEDGSLWVIVADITGHGYSAYLLAQALPGVWRAVWSRGLVDPEPIDVLSAMHDLLQECLPDDVFVECTLLRLAPSGQVTVAAAGGSRLLLHDVRRGRLDLLKLRGMWLGLGQPSSNDQQVYTLEEGDELLVGSDGAFDQLSDPEGETVDVARSLQASARADGLLEAMQAALQTALRERPQRDDITVVTLRRRRG